MGSPFQGCAAGIPRATVGAALLLACANAFANGGVYKATKHGDRTSGVFRLDTEGRGECAHCHDQHASRQGMTNGGAFPFLLFARNDNAFCATCHEASGSLAIYPGTAPWAQSSHAQSSSMIWPGPTPPSRPSSDAGKCINCHDPHGTKDGSGLVPALTTVREEGLCVPCHDGSPAADIRSQLRKPFVHAIATAGRHDEAEGSDPALYGTGGHRHSECADCHNPHMVASDPFPPGAPNASNRLLGVGRVKVTNGPAGTRPIYTFAGPGERSFPAEYEVCFKCHSSWTTRPAGQSDHALLFNPNNPSFHPVEAPGRNPRISSAAFVNGWTADRLTYCTDCHSSDDPSVRGPHGSSFRRLLKMDYSATSTQTSMAPTELCFDCHSWSTYAEPSASATALRASRFNPPAIAEGHAFHVGQQGYSCFVCHQSHGSTQLPALLVTGRSPGLLAYTQGATGGTCATTCHAGQPYSINYAR